MKTGEFTIKKGSGDSTVEGYIYNGFGITKHRCPGVAQWEATIISSGLKIASAPIRKVLIHKLDTILSLVPKFESMTSQEQINSIRDSIPNNMGTYDFAHWLNPTSLKGGCSGRVEWKQFKRTKRHI